MNSQTDMRLDFPKILCHLIKESYENSIIRLNYQNKISLLKDSLNLPKELPSSEEIHSFFTFLKEMQKTPKAVALKSFFIKTKVFLVWMLSAYEFFSQRALEILVNFYLFFK